MKAGLKSKAPTVSIAKKQDGAKPQVMATDFRTERSKVMTTVSNARAHMRVSKDPAMIEELKGVISSGLALARDLSKKINAVEGQ